MRKLSRTLIYPQIWTPAIVVVVCAVVLAAFVIGPGVSLAATGHSGRGPQPLTLNGDWARYLATNGRSGFNSAETTLTPTTAPNLHVNWTYAAKHHIAAEPIVSGGTVYIGSWDGYERALSLSGTLLWQTFLGVTRNTTCPSTTGIDSTPTIASVSINGVKTQVLYIGGGDQHVYALNAQTGAVIWSTLLSSAPGAFIWSSPVVVMNRVYIGLASQNDCPLVQGGLYQLNAQTGIISNTFNAVPDGCLGGSIWGSPTVDRAANAIYVATGNQGTCGTTELYFDSIVKLNLTDLSYVDSWQVPAGQQKKDGDFGSTPTLFKATINGTVHMLVGAVNKNGVYYAMDRSSLSAGPVWSARVADMADCSTCGEAIAPSMWDGHTLYVANRNTSVNGTACLGSVRALNPATGAFLWEHCFQEGPVMGAVTGVPGLVIVGEGTNLVVLDATNGNALFTYTDSNTNSFFWGAASVSSGVLYIGNWDGNLYAFGV